MWVKFYGTNQLGTVTKKSNWVDTSESAIQKFVTKKNLEKPTFYKAMVEFKDMIKVSLIYVQPYTM